MVIDLSRQAVCRNERRDQQQLKVESQERNGETVLVSMGPPELIASLASGSLRQSLFISGCVTPQHS